MTASFPACETTESRTTPRSTYMTLVAGSPRAKIVAAGSYSMRCSATPVQSTRSGGVSGMTRLGLLIAVAVLQPAPTVTPNCAPGVHRLAVNLNRYKIAPPA
jgi:hypothetical protein